MTVHDLRELIQDDIITCVDSYWLRLEVEFVVGGDHIKKGEEVKTHLSFLLCQTVVDRINEYENDITTINPLEDGPFGTKRIVTKSGSVFFRNSNGIFDPKTGKKRFASMAEFRRFEAHEHNLLGD